MLEIRSHYSKSLKGVLGRIRTFIGHYANEFSPTKSQMGIEPNLSNIQSAAFADA